MNQRTVGCVLATVLIVLGSTESWATTGDEDAFLDAVRTGNLEQVQRYLKAGGDVDASTEYFERGNFFRGRTALMVAAEAGHADVVAALLQGGADINFQEYYAGKTALIFAAEAGHGDVVAALLQGGADPNFPNRNGVTALDAAMEAGHDAITDMLRAGGGVPNKNRHNMALLAAAESIDRGESGADTAAAALEAGADPNFRDDAGRTALMKAALSDCTNMASVCDEELVDVLLANGADPNLQDEDGNTALMLVAKHAPDSTDETALQCFYRDYCFLPAAQTNPEIVRNVIRENDPHSILFAQLLKGGTDPTLPNKAGNTMVKIAEARGEAVLADVLREAGGDPKFALLRVAAEGDGAKVAELLAAGAAVDLQSGDGHTALRLAARAGHGVVVAVLLAAGAAVDLRSGDGRTALVDAAAKGHADMVAALLAAGAAVDLQDEAGNTALLYAAARGHSDVVAALLGAGADPILQNELGETALEMAEGWEHSTIADMLRKAGAADAQRQSAERPQELRNSIGMEFVLIEPGTFEMGSPETEPGRGEDETLHTVTISQPFYLGKYEVTREQWEAVTGSNIWRNDCGRCPVDSVGWKRVVQGFIAELNKREGVNVYRLPTEAEWEYAARAGTRTAYYFGDDVTQLGAYAWYKGNSDGQPHPVGKKQPNGWGLYDMHGSVWEWVHDCYHENYNGAPSAGQAWERGECSHRVLRGGSWDSDPGHLRSANRVRYPDGRSFDLGFRLARSLP